MFGARILVLIPHPDDEIVGCGSLIARVRAEGSEVHGLTLTTGIPAAERLWPWQRRGYEARIARRYAEHDLAAAILGLVGAGRLKIPSRTLKDHLLEAVALVDRAIESARPDRLWVPAYEGAHQDHDVANFLASLVRQKVETWEFSEYAYWGRAVRSNRFPEPHAGQVEIELTAAERQRKQALLALYRSERSNLRHICTRRESIRPLADHDYAQPPHEPPLFYQRFQWVPYHPRVDQTRPGEVCQTLSRFRATVDAGHVAERYTR